MEQQTAERFEGWCIVELMGHNVIAGYVSEQVIGGAAMLRVDVPPAIDAAGIARTDSQGFTKFFAASAVYAITPTTEAQAREAASRIKARPVSLWIVPDPKPALPMREYQGASDDFDDEEHNPF